MGFEKLPLETRRFALELYGELLREGGFVLHEDSLSRALGYKSVTALSKAIERKQVSLPLFKIPKRRGVFCLTADVAEFLALNRAAGI